MDRVCRVCLAEDRKTFIVANTALEQTYDVVTGVKLQRAGRPTALCCVCVSQLRRCRKFIETARESNDALDRWYQNHTHTDWKLMERPLLSFKRTPTECVIWYPHLKHERSTETVSDDAAKSDAGAFVTVEIKNEIICNDVQSDPLQVFYKTNDKTQTSDHKDNTLTSGYKQYNTQMSVDEQDKGQTSDDENDMAMECSSGKSHMSDVSENVRNKTASSSNVKTKCMVLDLDIASTSHKSEKRLKFDQDIIAYTANIKNDDKAAIVALHKDGRNISQIANATGFTRKTVRRWVKRYKEEGSLESRVRSGRRPLLAHSQRRFMLTEYEKNGYVTPRDFAEVFDTSVQTVRRALHSEGLHRKQFLLQQHRDERLRFSRKYLDFNWETTVFCDDKTFRFSQKEGLKLCPKNNTRKITLNLWGWMSAQGPGELAFMNSRADSEQYIEYLSDTMLPTVRTIYLEDDLPEINFVHDNNSPISRSQSVQHWFSEQSNIKVIPWPPRSPDLNPLESLWDIMVQRWEALGEMSPEQVKSHCLQLWDSLRGTDVCANSVASIRQRLQSCIDNNGGHI